MKQLIAAYTQLTKFGIVVFVLLSGIAGYALAFFPGDIFRPGHFLTVVLGLYFLSSGSLALNQLQEIEIDRKMRRTEKRPLVSGQFSRWQVAVLSLVFIFMGLLLCTAASKTAGIFGLATIFLYNGLYTYWWKKEWTFAAVPGAIPGALPVVIGYAANQEAVFNSELFYAFLVMFLWQMPHFWSLAIRYKDDYAQASIPVLPSMLGTERALYHIGLYTFVYVALAMASPWLTTAYWAYLVLVVPFAMKVLYEFYRYARSEGKERWLGFFLWTNFSVLVFLLAPVIDKWYRHFVVPN
jgi:heme o synthase